MTRMTAMMIGGPEMHVFKSDLSCDWPWSVLSKSVAGTARGGRKWKQSNSLVAWHVHLSTTT
jgi:hypothetical protein